MEKSVFVFQLLAKLILCLKLFVWEHCNLPKVCFAQVCLLNFGARGVKALSYGLEIFGIGLRMPRGGRSKVFLFLLSPNCSKNFLSTGLIIWLGLLVMGIGTDFPIESRGCFTGNFSAKSAILGLSLISALRNSILDFLSFWFG